MSINITMESKTLVAEMAIGSNFLPFFSRNQVALCMLPILKGVCRNRLYFFFQDPDLHGRNGLAISVSVFPYIRMSRPHKTE